MQENMLSSEAMCLLLYQQGVQTTETLRSEADNRISDVNSISSIFIFNLVSVHSLELDTTPGRQEIQEEISNLTFAIKIEL